MGKVRDLIGSTGNWVGKHRPKKWHKGTKGKSKMGYIVPGQEMLFGKPKTRRKSSKK